LLEIENNLKDNKFIGEGVIYSGTTNTWTGNKLEYTNKMHPDSAFAKFPVKKYTFGI
jgi:hypothetical protein